MGLVLIGAANGRADEALGAGVGTLLKVLTWLLRMPVSSRKGRRTRVCAGGSPRVRRTSLPAQLAGLETRTGETPIEFWERVARAFPESAAAYARRDVAKAREPALLARWGSVRPLLLRWAAPRVLLARGRGAAGVGARPAPP